MLELQKRAAAEHQDEGDQLQAPATQQNALELELPEPVPLHRHAAQQQDHRQGGACHGRGTEGGEPAAPGREGE